MVTAAGLIQGFPLQSLTVGPSDITRGKEPEQKKESIPASGHPAEEMEPLRPELENISCEFSLLLLWGPTHVHIKEWSSQFFTM